MCSPIPQGVLINKRCPQRRCSPHFLFLSTVTPSSKEWELHRGHYYSALARWNYFIDLLSRISLNSNWCQYSWFFGTTIKILFSSSIVQYGGCWIHSWFSLYSMWCAQTIIYRCREMGMKHRMDVWLLGNSQILKYWSRKSIQILSYFKITFLTFYTISQMGKHWFLCRSLHEVRVAFEG